MHRLCGWVEQKVVTVARAALLRLEGICAMIKLMCVAEDASHDFCSMKAEINVAHAYRYAQMDNNI